MDQLDVLRHVRRMFDDTGLLEHAEGSIPRREHGYCTDDNARALVALCRVDEPGVATLAERALAFVRHAELGGGRFLNRLSFDRRWDRRDLSDDASGRAIWALGVATSESPSSWIRRDASTVLRRCLDFTSPHARSMAYAALGVAAVYDAIGEAADALLSRAVRRIVARHPGATWAWPEQRLTYANAVLPHALLVAGSRLGDCGVIDTGLSWLAWLADRQLCDGRLSLVPAGGRGPGESPPGFDQQPIEAAELAGAAATAFACTGQRSWADLVDSAARWFSGTNDIGCSLIDHESGGCSDGLRRDGANANQGAESTISLLLTLQSRAAVATAAAASSLEPNQMPMEVSQ